MPQLRPVLAQWIKKKVYEVLDNYHPNPENWCTLVLTGSLTTFQYSDDSDCDVSVFVNPHFMPSWERAKLIALSIQHLDGVSGSLGRHINFKRLSFSPKVTKEMLYQPGLRSG